MTRAGTPPTGGAGADGVDLLGVHEEGIVVTADHSERPGGQQQRRPDNPVVRNVHGHPAATAPRVTHDHRLTGGVCPLANPAGPGRTHRR